MRTAWLAAVAAVGLAMEADGGTAVGAAGAPEAVARRYVGRLAAGEFEAATGDFDAEMARAMPAGRLEHLWTTLQRQAGAFRELRSVALEKRGGHTAALARCRFGQGDLVLRVVVDGTGRIAGFFVQPAPPEPGGATPPAPPLAANERAVAVGSGPALPGVLSLPPGEGRHPAVVLVHGSGPSDADATVGAARPFRDLAAGLSARGVVVLRHAKRTLVRPEGVRTVREEVLDGVRDALALLAARPEVDPRRVAVVGLSLGGYLAPWVAREHPEVAGLALLNAPARPLPVVLAEQVEARRAAAPGDEARAALEPLRRAAERAAAPDLGPDEPILGATGAYFLDLRGYDPVKEAQALPRPILVMQGGRDTQVSVARDFGAWQAALAGRAGAELRLFPGLGHLLVPEPAAGSEGAAPQVDPTLIEALAGWIRALPPAPPGAAGGAEGAAGATAPRPPPRP